MGLHYTTTVRKLGVISGIAVPVLSLLYASVLVLGFLSLSDPGHPIGDPWFSGLEILIIVMMPFMVSLIVAVHAWAPERVKALSLLALIFMSMTAALTVCVHFSILMLHRTPEFRDEPWVSLLLSFRWPSVAYAIDILAWDLFFALSMFFAAPVFAGGRLAAWIRSLLIVSGALALAGVSGVIAGDMRLRNIGIAGYVGVFPIAAGLMALLFYRTRAQGLD